MPWVLTIASSQLAWLGFAGMDLWPCALVAFVPLLFALQLAAGWRTRRVILLACLFGTLAQAGGYYWIFGTLHKFSGFPIALCLALSSIFWLYTGGVFVLTAWLTVRALRRGWSPMLAFVSAFVAAEFVYPQLFPYYYGASLHMLPAMIQVADLGGPLLVSAVVAAVNAALFELLRARLDRRGASRTGLIAVAAALVLTLAYGAYRIWEVDRRAARADVIRVGVVQANMGLIGKRMDPREGLTRHLEQTRDLERRGRHDLIVWPETSFPYLVPEKVHNMRRFMPDIHTPLLFGAPTSRRSGDRERLYNTAILVDADGEVLGTYDKTYLLAFGEYIPFGETFPRLYAMSPQSGRFTPGDHQRSLRLGSHRISTLICYEDVIPRFVRSAVGADDPHLLVNLTNDSWFGNTTEPWIHLALAKLRAVEHHRSLVRATNSGVSAVVDPVGRVVTKSGVFAPDTLSVNVRLMQGGTLYRSLGSWPGWIALAISCWLVYAPARPGSPVRDDAGSNVDSIRR